MLLCHFLSFPGATEAQKCSSSVTPSWVCQLPLQILQSCKTQKELIVLLLLPIKRNTPPSIIHCSRALLLHSICRLLVLQLQSVIAKTCNLDRACESSPVKPKRIIQILCFFHKTLTESFYTCQHDLRSSTEDKSWIPRIAALLETAPKSIHNPNCRGECSYRQRCFFSAVLPFAAVNKHRALQCTKTVQFHGHTP